MSEGRIKLQLLPHRPAVDELALLSLRWCHFLEPCCASSQGISSAGTYKSGTQPGLRDQKWAVEYHQNNYLIEISVCVLLKACKILMIHYLRFDSLPEVTKLLLMYGKRNENIPLTQLSQFMHVV